MGRHSSSSEVDFQSKDHTSRTFAPAWSQVYCQTVTYSIPRERNATLLARIYSTQRSYSNTPWLYKYNKSIFWSSSFETTHTTTLNISSTGTREYIHHNVKKWHWWRLSLFLPPFVIYYICNHLWILRGALYIWDDNLIMMRFITWGYINILGNYHVW